MLRNKAQLVYVYICIFKFKTAFYCILKRCKLICVAGLRLGEGRHSARCVASEAELRIAELNGISS